MNISRCSRMFKTYLSWTIPICSTGSMYACMFENETWSNVIKNNIYVFYSHIYLWLYVRFRCINLFLTFCTYFCTQNLYSIFSSSIEQFHIVHCLMSVCTLHVHFTVRVVYCTCNMSQRCCCLVLCVSLVWAWVCCNQPPRSLFCTFTGVVEFVNTTKISFYPWETKHQSSADKELSDGNC